MKKTFGLMAILTALGACEMAGGTPAPTSGLTPDDCALDVPNRPPSATCETDD